MAARGPTSVQVQAVAVTRCRLVDAGIAIHGISAGWKLYLGSEGCRNTAGALVYQML
jgi:hypothetical protein